MPLIDVKGHLIEFPDNLSPDELNKAASEAAKQLPDLFPQEQPEKKGVIAKAWDALAVPEKMSREGLGMMADMVPEGKTTGNMAADIVRGTPKILADTMAEAAPPFVSRGSILTGGALKAAQAAAPLARMAGRGIAKAAEGISGLEYKTPGVLTEAFKDPSLIFAPGKASAGEKFVEFMDPSKIRPSFGRATNPHELIADALKAFDEGTLTPQESVIARQTLDSIKKTVPRYAFNKMRESFDSIAKTVSKEADAAYSRGVKADALRNVFSQNKGGGTSIAKGFLGVLSSGKMIPPMSPLFQGSIASALGFVNNNVARPLMENALTSGSAMGALADLVRRYSKER